MRKNLRVFTVLSVVLAGVTSSAGAEESVNPSRVSSGIVQSIYESRNFRKYPMLGKNYVIPPSNENLPNLGAASHCIEGKTVRIDGAPSARTASELKESKNIQILFNESMSFNPDIAAAINRVKSLQDEYSKDRFLEVGQNNKQLAECRKKGATNEEFLLRKKINDHFSQISSLYEHFENAKSPEKKKKYRNSLVKLVGENAMKSLE